MTMKSIIDDTRRTASLSTDSKTIGIDLDWEGFGITVSTEEFVKEVMALGIPGLTYEPPLVLPTEPGLYIRKRDEEKLEDGPWTFRLSSYGQWSHLNGGQSYSEEEMRSKLPLVRLIVKED